MQNCDLSSGSVTHSSSSSLALVAAAGILLVPVLRQRSTIDGFCMHVCLHLGHTHTGLFYTSSCSFRL